MRNSKPQRKQSIEGELLSYCISEFIDEKKARNLSPDTIKSYEQILGNFLKFARQHESVKAMGEVYIDDITKTMIQVDYVNYLKEGLANNKGIKNKPKSINTKLIVIRTFINWCQEDNRRYISDKIHIDLIKAQEEKPKDYTLEEVEALIATPNKRDTFVTWRTWAICMFVYGTGARIGTLLDMRMEDINLTAERAFYRHTKNKKLQEINIPPKLASCLRKYISMWRQDTDGDDYLFCNGQGKKLDKRVFRQGYIRYANKRGVSKTNIHGLRHTFAREWFLNGGDVVQLSKVLGHSSITMSMHYMNVYASDRKEKFVQANPLENLSRGKRGKVTVSRS